MCTFVRSLRQTVSHDCDDFVHMQCLPHRDADKNSAKIERSMRARLLQAMQGRGGGGVTRERDSYRQCKGGGCEGR